MTNGTKVAHALESEGAVGKLLRALGLPALGAALVLAFNAGQTLDGIQQQAEANCRQAIHTQVALYVEHRNDKYASLFPKPDPGVCNQ